MKKEDISWTLVTGGAKRLGAAIVRELIRQGHAVVVHYNGSQKEARLLVEELREAGGCVAMIQGSFESTHSTNEFIKRYKKEFPKTKYLVNNVGNYVLESLTKTPEEIVKALFQVNLFSPLSLIQGLIDTIIQEKGAIVNVGVSGLSGGKADINAPVFTMTKQALLSMTKSLAKEVAPHGVRVNMVSPGRLNNSVDYLKGAASIPMKRVGTVDDVAPTVCYYLSDITRYITGQNIDVSGGLGL